MAKAKASADPDHQGCGADLLIADGISEVVLVKRNWPSSGIENSEVELYPTCHDYELLTAALSISIADVHESRQ